MMLKEGEIPQSYHFWLTFKMLIQCFAMHHCSCLWNKISLSGVFSVALCVQADVTSIIYFRFSNWSPLLISMLYTGGTTRKLAPRFIDISVYVAITLLKYTVYNTNRAWVKNVLKHCVVPSVDLPCCTQEAIVGVVATTWESLLQRFAWAANGYVRYVFKKELGINKLCFVCFLPRRVQRKFWC